MEKSMYKLSYGKSGFKNVLYFDNWSEAQKKADALRKYNEFTITLKRRRVTLVYHHSALARGYVRKCFGYREWYAGRFGQGFVEHEPTLDSSCSCSYHQISYYIEK